MPIRVVLRALRKTGRGLVSFLLQRELETAQTAQRRVSAAAGAEHPLDFPAWRVTCPLLNIHLCKGTFDLEESNRNKKSLLYSEHGVLDSFEDIRTGCFSHSLEHLFLMKTKAWEVLSRK